MRICWKAELKRVREGRGDIYEAHQQMERDFGACGSYFDLVDNKLVLATVAPSLV